MRRPTPPTAAAATPRWSLLSFSEETRESINRITEYAKQAVYYGWIPLVLIIGTYLAAHREEPAQLPSPSYHIITIGFWKSEPRPSFFRMLNPLS